MNRTPLIAFLIILIVAGGGYFFYRSAYRPSRYKTIKPTQQPVRRPVISSPTPRVSPQSTASPSALQNTVNISATGFQPQSITIKAGQNVTWTNKDKVNHQVNSVVHPTHLVYPPLNTIGLLKPGESKSLTFRTAGTYKYHDHLNPSLRGQVIVQ